MFGLILFKRLFYNRYVPITQILDEMKEQKFRKLLLGNIFVIAYYAKRPQASFSQSYAISSMNYFKPKKVVEAA